MAIFHLKCTAVNTANRALKQEKKRKKLEQ